MVTTTSLRAYTHKDLCQMAKRKGITGWHAMRKDELVQALVKAAKSKSKSGGKKTAAKSASKAKKSTSSTKSKAKSPAAKSKVAKRKPAPKTAAKKKSPVVTRKLNQAHTQRERQMDLSRTNGSPKGRATNGKPLKDRIVLMVRDPYWLHAHWEISARAIERAQAAMAEHWHHAKPILRLYEVDGGATTNTTKRVSRDIEIHGGVQNWYIDVADPPTSFAVEIGYLSADGSFHGIARSNSVTTPRPGSNGASDGNWSDVAANCEKIYALSGGYSSEPLSGELRELFEERLKRPMGSPMSTRYGLGADNVVGRDRMFDLQVDAEMVVYGTTRSNAYLTLAGEPLKVKEDGTFSVRMKLDNNRQVLPVVAESADGVEQRTVVIAVERNTKVMEPITRDPNEV